MKKLLFLFAFFLISIIGKNQITQQQIDAYKGTTTNTVNAYSVTISSVTASAPYDGQKIWVKFNAANIGAATLQVNNYTARAITLNGSALVANDLVINQYVSLVYYLAGTSWQMTRPGAGAGVGTVTSVDGTGGTGITVTGTPITTSGTFTVTNTAPNQTVTLTGAGTTTISGTYPTYTVTGGGVNVSDSAWSLTGNAGTVDGTNFIGTTDDIPFDIRREDSVYVRLVANGFTGIGAATTTASATGHIVPKAKLHVSTCEEFGGDLLGTNAFNLFNFTFGRELPRGVSINFRTGQDVLNGLFQGGINTARITGLAYESTNDNTPKGALAFLVNDGTGTIMEMARVNDVGFGIGATLPKTKLDIREGVPIWTGAVTTYTATTSSYTVTAAELSGGTLRVSGTGTVSLTLPTATDLGTQLGWAANKVTVFPFSVLNESTGDVTIVVNTGITVSTYPTLTDANELIIPITDVGVLQIASFNATTANIKRIQ